MANTLSERLRRLSEMVEDHHDFARESVMLRNAAAELDRREAIVAAAEAWAKAHRTVGWDATETIEATNALLALLPAAALKG